MAKIQVIATPIGNLEDISQRALRCLKEADLIAAEDTRTTSHLLARLDLPKKKLVSYHDHNEIEKARELIEEVQNQDLTLALVSDAGTPCISDPGYRLTQIAHQFDIPVEPIPGPCAMAALISASGLPSNRFTFVGFIQNCKQAEIQEWQGTYVFYENPKRILKTLKNLQNFHPKSSVCIGRELTKMFEEISQFPMEDAISWAQNHEKLKGELCVVIHCPSFSDLSDLDKKIHDEALFLFQRGLTHKDLMAFFKDRGLEKKVLYNLLLDTQKSL